MGDLVRRILLLWRRGDAADASPAKAATAAPANSLHSLSDISSATWKLQQKKFEVGSYVQERGGAPHLSQGENQGKRQLMQITSINDATETINLKQVVWHTPDIKCFEGAVGTV